MHGSSNFTSWNEGCVTMRDSRFSYLGGVSPLVYGIMVKKYSLCFLALIPIIGNLICLFIGEAAMVEAYPDIETRDYMGTLYDKLALGLLILQAIPIALKILK